MRLFLTTFIIAMAVGLAQADNHRQSYDDCLVKSIGWLTTDRAIQLVDETCISEIKAKETKKAAQMVELLKQNKELLKRNGELEDMIKLLEARIARPRHIDCFPPVTPTKMFDMCSQLLDDATNSSQRID